MIKYAHVRPQNTNSRSGGYTIAFFNDAEQRKVSYAYARCNAKDNFNKSIGRKIAGGRLDAGVGEQHGVIDTRATRYSTIVGKIVEIVEAEIATARKNALKRKRK